MKNVFARSRKPASWLLIIAIVLGTFLPSAPVAAAVPKMRAAVTSGNVMKLLKAYDTDGYFLLSQAKKKGKAYMRWFTSGTITKDIDTAVHESSHAFTGGEYYPERIYRGNEKYYKVYVTEIFRSQEMADSVPSACRTTRFSTYVQNASGSMASNVMGAYGLLNEFCAYGWGMNNTVKLYPYYEKYVSSPGDWVDFINSGANDRQAYAEFLFFILHYLSYAKKYHPAVYKGIINNKQFRAAFKFTDRMFRNNITKYEADLTKIKKTLKKQGVDVQISGDFILFDKYGVKLFQKDYDAIRKVISKKRYQKIYEALIQ